MEENDAKNLIDEIDTKIYALKNQPVEISLFGNADRISHQSELAEIFTHDELDAWVATQNLKEELYVKNSLIV